MSDELKPCPFCQREPQFIEVQWFPNGERAPAYVSCRYCGIKSHHGYDNAEVIKAWNARPIEDALRADLTAANETIAVMREALEKIAEDTYCEGPGCWFCEKEDGHPPSAMAMIAQAALAKARR